MDHLGIEPRTYQLKAEYSTIELVIRIYIKYILLDEINIWTKNGLLKLFYF